MMGRAFWATMIKRCMRVSLCKGYAMAKAQWRTKTATSTKVAGWMESELGLMARQQRASTLLTRAMRFTRESFWITNDTATGELVPDV